MTKKLLLVPLVTFLAVSLIAIGWATPTEATPRTLKIGYITALTGFLSSLGIQYVDGALAVKAMINDQGGIVVNGQPYLIEIIVEDNKTTVEGTVAATNKLIYEDNVKFIAGGDIPFVIESEGTVTEPAGVLRSILWNSCMPDEFGPNTPNTFMSQVGALENNTTSYKILTELYPEAKKIVAVMCDDGSGLYLGKKTLERVKEKGLTHLGNIVGWTPDTVNFAPVMVSVLARKPDAIHLFNGAAEHFGAQLKAAREQGFNGPVFWNCVNAFEIVNIAGAEAATNAFCIGSVTLDAPDNYPMVEKVGEWIIAVGGKKPGYWTQFEGFQSVWAILKAIEAAQSIDPTVVRDTWEKMETMESIYGPAPIGGLETHGIKHTVCCPLAVQTVDNGKVTHLKWVKTESP